jgi:hypothetical protein
VFREFIRYHDDRIIDAHFRVTEPSVRHQQLVNFGGTEGTLVKIQRFGCVLNCEIGRDSMMSGRNC